MNYKEITELIKLVSKSELSEFRLKEKDFEISIRTNSFQSKGAQYVQTVSSSPIIAAPAASVQAPQAAAPTPKEVVVSPAAADSSAGLIEIKSPMVGTFYRSSSPDKPSFAKAGDTIEKGSTVCIIEAMKLFNEIESEVSGTIVKVLVEDAAPVEYDQVLFLVEPK